MTHSLVSDFLSGGGMPKRDISNREMLNEIKRMQALILKVDLKSFQAQTITSQMFWKSQVGLQNLYFEYQCGLWGVEELKGAGEFCMTLAIGVLAMGIALLFWPIYLISGFIFVMSYYYLLRVRSETKEWETRVSVAARKLTDSISVLDLDSS
jgi:hypothetical protein